MNLGSWFVLSIVVAIVGLAIKATFFNKKPRGGCCDVGDKPSGHSCCESKNLKAAEESPECDGSDYEIKMASGACGNCTLCSDSAVTRNAVIPVIKPVE